AGPPAQPRDDHGQRDARSGPALVADRDPGQRVDRVPGPRPGAHRRPHRLGPPPATARDLSAGRRDGPLNSQDIVLISPLIAGVLTAAAILIVDLIRPGKPSVAVGVALAGLAITAILTIAVGNMPGTAYGGTYKVDALTTFLDIPF